MADPGKLGDVEIVPYDPRWPIVYAGEEAQLLGRTGGLFTQIEHIGSTSIPGMSAKPTIDLMAAIASLKSLDAVVTDLAGHGYRELSENFSLRRFFRKEAAGGLPSFHLHVVQEGAWRQKSERLFRDRLIARPALADEYARLKAALAQRFPGDREAYTAAKSDFIRRVVIEARRALGLKPILDWTE